MHPFRIRSAASVAETLSVLAEHGDTARIYAGGTELLLALKMRLGEFAHLIDIKSIPALQVLERDPETGALRIGAAVTHRTVERSPLVAAGWPLLAEVERTVANVRVRNVGTLAGNLCFSEPHSDIALLSVLLDAELLLVGPDGARTMLAADFLLAPFTTALASGELLVEIRIPRLPAGSAWAYHRMRHHERPTAAVGVGLIPAAGGGRVERAIVAVGCAGPRPIRVPAAEARLAGLDLDQLLAADPGAPLSEAARIAAEAAEAIEDSSGSVEYKTAMMAVLVERACREAAAKLRGGTAGV